MVSAAPEPQRRMNILVVDDEPAALVALEATLQNLGENVVTAGSGVEALRHLLAGDFAIVLLDVNMPGLDGYETAALIRERPRSRNTPIIFLTASLTADVQRFRGYAAGAVDYLYKPIEAEVLRSKVAVFVELARKTALLQEQSEALGAREREARALAEERTRLLDDIEQRVQARTRALQRSSRALRLLSDCGKTLIRSADEQSLLQAVCDLVVGTGEYRFCGVWYADESAANGVRLGASAGGHPDSGGAFWADADRARALLSTVIKTGRHLVQNDIADYPELATWKDAVQRLGLELIVGLPLAARSQVLGVLAIGAGALDAFSAEELSLLSELADNVAYGIGALRTRAGLRTAEAESRAVTARLEHLIATSQTVIYARAPQGGFATTYVSGNVKAQLGYSPDAFLTAADFWAKRLHPQDAPRVLACLESALTTGCFCGEYRFRHADGGYRWLRDEARVSYEAAGTPREVIGTWVDITDRKLAEESQQQSDRRYRALVESSPEIIIVAELDGEIVLANPASAELLGYAHAQELCGRHMPELIAPEDRATAAEAFARAIAENRLDRYACRALRADGSAVAIEWTAATIPDAAGQALAVLAIGRDITPRLRAEQEVRALNADLEQRVRERTAEAEAANRAKSLFLANMSHEIRTPMNAILGFAQLLRREPELSARQRQYLDTILRAGDHLLALICDILEYSKIEAGRVEAELSTFAPAALFEELAALFRVRARDKGLRFIVEVGPAMPRCIVSDAGKLRQILQNLLSNALKFTHRGGITLRVDARRAAPGGGEVGLRLVAEVEDTGAGIAPEEMNSLFQVFEQTESGRRSKKGTGLGLAISRKLAEVLGGTIDVISRVDEGSVFRVEIPVAPGVADALPPRKEKRRVIALAPDQPPYRVLVVDDVDDNRAYLAGLLSAVGFEVRTAENGVEAVAAFAEWAPQLILMDLRMPVMTGFEAIAAIRGREDGAAVRIVAVSASAFREDRSHALAAGADDYLSKPFREEVVFAKLESALGARYLYAEDAVTAVPAAPSEGARAGTETASEAAAAAAASLPADLSAELRQAILGADLDRVLELATQVEPRSPDLAGELRRLADDFAYPSMLALLDRSGSAPPHPDPSPGEGRGPE
ncbi:MAG: response regulator [Candidatus Schekmanbacteria bacterium]|nr:response regulator [Candidatus Schekmanbacteria bacterium]